MDRLQLEKHIEATIDNNLQWVFLLMEGDPNSSRQRLLGHHFGPYGWVCGSVSGENIVRFNVHHLQDYLDELTVDLLSWDDDVGACVATLDVLTSHTFEVEQGRA